MLFEHLEHIIRIARKYSPNTQAMLFEQLEDGAQRHLYAAPRKGLQVQIAIVSAPPLSADSRYTDNQPKVS